MTAIYKIKNNGRFLTKAGEEMWKRFTEVYKEVQNDPFFDDIDDGELADLFAYEFPRLSRYEMYLYILFDGER